MNIIDSHQHYWKVSRGDYGWLTPKLTTLYRDFLPEDLQPDLDKHNITGTIVVQAADSMEETRYLLSLAEKYQSIIGVVGWVDMQADNVVEVLAELAGNPYFRGIRPMIQDIADDQWMLKAELMPAFQALPEFGLTFDALVLPRHLDYLLQLLNKNPDLDVVIDHAAKPQIKTGEFTLWAERIKMVADNSRAYCKLSGIVTEAGTDWTVAQLKPYIEHLLDCFGENRIMWGSDWPVLNLASDYDSWFELSQNYLSQLSISEKQAIFSDNALHFYGIKKVG